MPRPSGAPFPPSPSADAAPDRGDGAVARAADRYGVSEAALRTRLREDPSLRIDAFRCGVLHRPGADQRADSRHELIAQAFPLPTRSSCTASRTRQGTIYLDFNGHNVSNTLWNGLRRPGPGNLPNGSHPAMDLAGNGAAFTDAELLQVQDIYQRVAEDYAPFDVDVTTEEPPAARHRPLQRGRPGLRHPGPDQPERRRR